MTSTARGTGGRARAGWNCRRARCRWHGTPFLAYTPVYSSIPCRFIINDTYRSEVCLLYPPHLIAVAAIYLVLVFHTPTRTAIQQQQTATSSSGRASSPTRRSSRTASHTHVHAHAQKRNAPPPQDVIGFMAGLNISMSLVATIAQEIVSLYALWGRYSEDAHAHASARAAFLQRSAAAGKRAVGTRAGRGGMAAVPAAGASVGDGEAVTPMPLVQLLLDMREKRNEDVAHPASGRPVAVNKMLERTQAAG